MPPARKERVKKMEIDYQQVVDLCAQAMAVGLPIGVIFGLAEKACNLFLALAFGKERVRI